MVREFKRRIGDETPIIVGDLSVAAEDIFAVVARWVVDRAQQHEGAAPAFIALSHPATWGGQHRLGLIRTALAGVGLGDVELVSEPEAAGLHYLDIRRRSTQAHPIAVYDLGGGTFDSLSSASRRTTPSAPGRSADRHRALGLEPTSTSASSSTSRRSRA